MPARRRVIGLCEHVLDCFLVVGAVGEVAPILAGQLPALERIALTCTEAAQLLILGYLEPHLDEHGALGRESCLPLHDLRIGAPPLSLAGDALHPLHEHAPVPRAVEHGHPAPARHRLGEAVHEVMAAVVVARGSELSHAHVPGVEHGDEPPDDPALSGGVPALEQHA